jgi:glyoxylase I family protein
MNNFQAIHHSSLIVSNTEISMKFYRDVLGMKPAPRNDLPFPGAWLWVGDQQIHLLELPNPDPVKNRPSHGGRDRHVAVLVNELATISKSLEQAGVDFTMSKSGRAALFCRDPDGNTIEIIEASN